MKRTVLFAFLGVAVQGLNDIALEDTASVVEGSVMLEATTSRSTVGVLAVEAKRSGPARTKDKSGIAIDRGLKRAPSKAKRRKKRPPTAKPTSAPTSTPTSAPTAAPTAIPTASPTAAPTAAPTSSPTATPTAAPTPPLPSQAPSASPAPSEDPTISCFPGDAFVTVEGVGQVKMRDVKIGDRVLGMGGKFQPIYAFGHKSLDPPTEYIRLYTNASYAPLEISSRHYVFLYDQQEIPAVPAFLKVGDVLWGGDATGSALEIIKIDTVMKKGVFAPLSADGTIAVNGVVASSYVFPLSYSFDQPSDYVYFLGRYKIMSHHAFSHLRLSPIRLASLGISPWFGSFADKEGRNYLSCAYVQADLWIQSTTRGFTIMAVGTVIFYSLCGIAMITYFIECLVGPVMGPTVIVLVIVASIMAFKKQTQSNTTAGGSKKVKIH